MASATPVQRVWRDFWKGAARPSSAVRMFLDFFGSPEEPSLVPAVVGTGPMGGVGPGPSLVTEIEELLVPVHLPRRTEGDRQLLEATAVSALRARSIFFGRELCYRRRAAYPFAPCRVLVLGGGYRSEVLDFLSDEETDANCFEVTIADADGEGLLAAQARAEAGGYHPSLATVRTALLEESAFDGPRALPLQEFIYSGFLFDFLPDDALIRWVEACFSLLKPGGQLLIAHYDADLSAAERDLLEERVGSSTQHRTSEEIVRLVGETSVKHSGERVVIHRGPNCYLVIERGDE